MEKEVTVIVPERAEVEVCNFDKDTAWVRWYMPDFSDNGNIDLPKGENYKLKQRVGDNVTVEVI